MEGQYSGYTGLNKMHHQFVFKKHRIILTSADISLQISKSFHCPQSPLCLSFFFFFSCIGSALELQVINFNFETVQVTWNTNADTGINFTFIYK